MPDLSRKSARAKLPTHTDEGVLRTEPYWQRIRKGQYLGYRRTSGTWIARYGEASPGKAKGGKGYRKGKQHYQPLVGVATDDYDAAKDAADAWFAQMGAAGATAIKRGTVWQALEDYVAQLREGGREASADDAASRFKTTVTGDPLARVTLESATKDDFQAWRKRLMKGREARSVNRQVRAVVAALNYAVSERGFVGTPAAWKLRALPDDTEESGESAVFLNPAQRKAIVGAAEGYAAVFLRGLELTGARPKELAAALVRDFDGESLRLAHRKGRPPVLKVRHTVLDRDGVEFFTRMATGRPATALLFTEDGEQQWRRHRWARAMNAAIKAVNGDPFIPPGASAYSFRHARISELLQNHGIDPLTVAQQTGTSLAMIEKAYLKFIKGAMLEKLAAVKAL